MVTLVLAALVVAALAWLAEPMTAQAQAAPSAPAGFGATAGIGEVALSWTDPADDTITRYQYRRSEDGGNIWNPDWTGIAGSGPTTVEYVVTGFTNGQLYTFEIRAVNPGGNGVVSDQVSATPFTVPGAPRNVAAAPLDRSARLTWDAPASDGGAPITGYEYRVTQPGSDEGVVWQTVSGSDVDTRSYEVPGLTNGEPYTLLVRAVNEAGAGAGVEAGAVTPAATPLAPTGFNAAGGDESAILSWTAADHNGAAITKYQYQQDGGAWMDIPDSLPGGANAASYTVTGLTNGIGYTFRLRAVNGVGVGAESDEQNVTLPPAEPTGLTAAPGHRQVTLAWEDPSDLTITGYQLLQLQEAKRTADDGAAGDYFGISVAVDGDTAVVGAYQNDDNGTGSGSAYVFTRTSGVWSQTAKLTADDGAAEDNFGWSVAVDGDTAVVGAHQNEDNGTNSGAAYVFTRTSGVWSQTVKLTADDGAAGDYFGVSVAVDGDTAVVGAYLDDDKGTNSGSAYVFVKPASGWADGTQTVKLTADDGATGDRFGVSVAVDGDTAVVGAYLDDDNGISSGSAYVFVKPASGWADGTQSVKLTADDGAAEDWFARSVAVDGDTAVVGAYLDDDNGDDSGSAYMFGIQGWADIPDSGSATTSHTVQRLTSGATYHFTVRAGNPSGPGGATMYGAGSDPASTTALLGPPNAPERLTAKPGDEEVVLSWVNPDDPTIIRYEYRQTDTYQTGDPVWPTDPTDNSEVWTRITASGADTTTHTVTGLDNDRTNQGDEDDVLYTFQVRAVNYAINRITWQLGVASDAVKANPGLPIDGPTGLTGSFDPETGKIVLEWDQHADYPGAEFAVNWHYNRVQAQRTGSFDGGFLVGPAVTDADGNAIFPQITATGTEVDIGAEFGVYDFVVAARSNFGPWSLTAATTSVTTSPFLDQPDATREVDKQAGAGSSVGKPVETRTPSGYDVRLSIDAPNGDFAIDSATGQITVTGGSRAPGAYPVAVTATVTDTLSPGTSAKTYSINLTINVTSRGPWTQQGKLTASDGVAEDSLGYAVAVDEASGTIVVGAKDHNGRVGAVYVYDGYDDDTPAKLTSPTTNAGEQFGYTVAIDGDTIVVGSTEADTTPGSGFPPTPVRNQAGHGLRVHEGC